MVAEPGGLDLLHYLPHGRICYLALTTQRPGLIRDLGYTLSVGRLIRSLFGYHLVFPLSLMELHERVGEVDAIYPAKQND